MVVIILITLFFCLVVALYVTLVLYVHDLSIKPLKVSALKAQHVLFIFAHPDDETMTCGGLMSLLATTSSENVFAVSVTAGEKGIEKLDLPPNELGPIRQEEYARALGRLSVKNYEVWSFNDGDTVKQNEELSARIRAFVQQNKIQVVVTHEKFGLYGHPDHIALAKAVHLLADQLNFRVLYSTLPNRILARIKLPKTLTYKDRTVELTPEIVTNPQYRINVYLGLLPKFRAAKEYKSQDLEHGTPLAILMAFGGFEYYTYEYPDKTL